MSTLAVDAPGTVTEARESESPVASGQPAPSAAPAERRGAPALVRNFDLVILAIALPVVLLASLPVLGYVVGAAAWLTQRLIFAVGQRRTRAAIVAGDRRLALGYTAGATLGRVWLVTLAVLLVGLLGARADGLTAAVLTAILVTFFLVGQAFDGLLGGRDAGPKAPVEQEGTR